MAITMILQYQLIRRIKERDDAVLIVRLVNGHSGMIKDFCFCYHH